MKNPRIINNNNNYNNSKIFKKIRKKTSTTFQKNLLKTEILTKVNLSNYKFCRFRKNISSIILVPLMKIKPPI